MALDHSRLGLENKSGPILCVRQVYFTKSGQQIGGCVNQRFILLIHHIWGERYYLSYRPRTDCTISQFFRQTALSQYSGRSIVGFWRNGSTNFQNHPYSEPVPSFDRRQICSASCGRVFEWTFKELRFSIINNLCLFFLFNGFITMCNLKNCLIRAAFSVLLKVMFMND